MKAAYVELQPHEPVTCVLIVAPNDWIELLDALEVIRQVPGFISGRVQRSRRIFYAESRTWYETKDLPDVIETHQLNVHELYDSYRLLISAQTFIAGAVFAALMDTFGYRCADCHTPMGFLRPEIRRCISCWERIEQERVERARIAPVPLSSEEITNTLSRWEDLIPPYRPERVTTRVRRDRRRP